MLGGLLIFYLMRRMDYRWYQNKIIVYGLLAVTAVLLLAVFGFPPINGARRWIRFPTFSFQPSEIAKIALPVFFAYFLTKNEDTVGELKETVLLCALVLGFFGSLIILEPDLGTTMVLCAVFIAMYFAAGAKILHLAAVGLGLLFIGTCALIIAPWRVVEITFPSAWRISFIICGRTLTPSFAIVAKDDAVCKAVTPIS